MVICLEQGADLHMAQLMPLPLTVSCFSKIQIGFTYLVPAHPGTPGKRAVKRVCVFFSNRFFDWTGEMEAIAKHEFQATAEDELSFHRGAKLKVNTSI